MAQPGGQEFFFQFSRGFFAALGGNSSFVLFAFEIEAAGLHSSVHSGLRTARRALRSRSDGWPARLWANGATCGDTVAVQVLALGLHAALCAALVAGALLAPNLLRKTMPGTQALMVASVVAVAVFAVVACALALRGLAMLRPITLLPVVIALAFLIRVAAPSIDATQSARPVARLLQVSG